MLESVGRCSLGTHRYLLIYRRSFNALINGAQNDALGPLKEHAL